jgi:hypothetical protein
MRVMIHAVNADKDQWPLFGGGKTTSVKASAFELQAASDGMRLWADAYENSGTGERGGEIKAIARHLSILLEPEDLQCIFEAALKAKLLRVPGLDSISEARSLLKRAITELEGGA